MTAQNPLPDSTEARAQRPSMEWIPGGTFTMGSDRHYREESPPHAVTVDGFWIDRWPVTNALFRQFVEETGYVTLAERRPRSGAVPGRGSELLVPGVGRLREPAARVDLAITSTGGRTSPARTGDTRAVRQLDLTGLDDHPVVHVALRRRRGFASGPARSCPPRRSGSSPRAAAWRAPIRLGRRARCPAAGRWRTPGRASSPTRTCASTATKGRRRSGRSRRTATASST